jgi:hypothetical protein
MHRSPMAFFALLFLAMSAAAWAQSNPATPKPGSGIPQQAPATAPTTMPPPAQQPATTVPDNTPPAEPMATPSTATQPASDANQPAAKTRTGSEQKTSADQKSGTDKAIENEATAPLIPELENPAPAEANPKTDILDSSATSGAVVTDGHDPILDPPPMPRTTTTMVGGTILSVDRLRNHMTVHVFGGGRWSVNFDERTHIFHNGRETTQLALKKGERVYVDTQLDNNKHDIFARNIRVGVTAPPADADGQIIAVDARHNELTLRDSLNSVPVRFAVDPETRISNGQTPAAFKDVKPGTLVHVRFSASSPNRGLAREVNIVAAPGTSFTFQGKVTFLDLHRGILAVQNSTDDKNYEIHFSTDAVADRGNLGVGRDVLVRATFEGTRYAAQSVSVTRTDEEK